MSKFCLHKIYMWYFATSTLCEYSTDNTYNCALVNKYNPTAEHFVVIGRRFPLIEVKRDAYISLLTNYVQIAAQ